MKKRLRVGVVGLGPIAQHEFLPYLHSSDGFRIQALCDISNTLVLHFGGKYGVRELYTDYRELVRSESIEAVVILNSCHTDVCIEAANAKKHILVEKPLCESPRQARMIESAVKKNNIRLMVAEMKRYDPGYQYGRELMKQLKDVRLIRVHDFCDGCFAVIDEVIEIERRIDISEADRRTDLEKWNDGLREVTGKYPPELYNFLLMAGSHDLNIMRGVFGDPIGVNYCNIWDNGRFVFSVLDYGEDASGTFEVGLNNCKWFDEYFVAYGLDKNVQITFPNPYLKNAPTIVEVKETKGGTIIEKRITASYEESFKKELDHFYQCITKDLDPVTNVEDGRKNVEILADMVKCYLDTRDGRELE
jgi:predicted dehydrogenase